LLEKTEKDVKNPEYHADFKSEEKFYKNAPQKVISKTNLTNMSKSEKSAYFHHIFVYTFFIWNFVPLFQRSQIQHTILFFYIHNEC
jgi:hypothetical protein